LGFTRATLVLSACNKRQSAPSTAQLELHPTSTIAAQDVPVAIAITNAAPSSGARSEFAGTSRSRLICETLHSCLRSDDSQGVQRWTCNEHALLSEPPNLTVCSTIGEDRPAERSAGGRCEYFATDSDDNQQHQHVVGQRERRSDPRCGRLGVAPTGRVRHA
jgi:hypothetical protein